MNGYTQKLFLFFLLPWSLLGAQTFSDIPTLLRKGQIRQAKDILQRLEENGEEPETILFLHGLLSTDADSAVVYYENYLQTYPYSKYSDDTLFRLAQLKYAQGLYKTAQNRFRLLLKEYPRSSLHQKCHYWIALCFTAMNQPDSATAQLQKTTNDFTYTDLTEIARRELEALENPEPIQAEEIPLPLPQATRYAVQVGAFSHQSNALLRKSFFEREGYHVDLRTKIREGKILYLIWVGSLKTREEAREFGERLRRRYGVQYTIVSE